MLWVIVSAVLLVCLVMDCCAFYTIRKLLKIETAKVENLFEELQRWRNGEIVLSAALPTSPIPNGSAFADVSYSVTDRDFGQEREHLHQQLDEKTTEINQQFQYGEKLRQHLLDQQDLIAASRKDFEKLQQDMGRIQTDSSRKLNEIAALKAQIGELRNTNQKPACAKEIIDSEIGPTTE